MSDQSGSHEQKAPNRRQVREVARIVLAVVALVVLVAFVVDNSHTVRVGFVFFSARISLIWALLIAAFLGMVVDRLIIFLGQRRRARTTQS
ncbi:MAG: hypothetical protein ACYCVN_04295 [Acidimicrobiales bacterium]